MSERVRAAIIRVMGPAGTVGTGFVIDRDRGLVATCAHVIDFTDALPGGEVTLIHHVTQRQFTAEVVAECYKPNDVDVAVLRLRERLPDEATAVLIGAETSPVGHEFWTFGFPAAKREHGLVGTGIVRDRNDVNGISLLQLSDADEIVPGFSGAPLYDTATRRVVGMVVEITEQDHFRLDDTAFGISIAVLMTIVPGLAASDIAPYKALDAFQEADAELYFGRRDTASRIAVALTRDRQRFIAILGPSGSGKSSLVRAGVIPAIRAENTPDGPWQVIVTRPADIRLNTPDVALLLGGSDGIGEWLTQRGAGRLLLVIDQFEEAFADRDESVPARLLSAVRDLVDSLAPVAVVLTMRDEFFSELSRRESTLTLALEEGLRTVPQVLSRENLTDIVAAPARLVGLEFDDGLIKRIVDDSIKEAPGAEPGTAANTVLPLLEFTLTQMWLRRQDGRMTHRAYEKVGKVPGGIGSWADGALRLIGSTRLSTAQAVLTDLVRLGDQRRGVPDSRTRRPQSALYRRPQDRQQVDEVVQILAEKRILVKSYDEANDEALIELIHDSLVREWTQLRAWLDTDRRFLTWQQRLEENRQAWEDSSDAGIYDDDKLLRGRDLDTALELEEGLANRLTDSQRTFVTASEDKRKSEEKREGRRRRIVRTLSSVSLVAALLLTSFALRASHNAKMQEEKAKANLTTAIITKLASHGGSLIGSHRGDTRGFQELLIADSMDGQRTPDAMFSAVMDRQSTLKILQTPAPARAVAFSTDGRLVAAGTNSGDILVWSVESGALIYGPRAVDGRSIKQLTFAGDERVLALTAEGEIWEVGLASVESSKPILLRPSIGIPVSVAMSADGNQIAFTRAENGQSNVIHVMPVRSGPDDSTTFVADADKVTALAFSPDGRIIVAASEFSDATNGGVIQSWGTQIDDTVARSQTIPCPDNTEEACRPNPVWTVAVTNSGQMAAGGFGDGKTALIAEGFPPSGFEFNAGYPDLGNGTWNVSFDPASRLLAAGGVNDDIRVWNVDDGSLRGTLQGHSADVHSVAFGPMGKVVASGGDDNSVRLWATPPQQPNVVEVTLERYRDRDGEEPRSVALDMSGARFAAGYNDGTLHVWDTKIGRPTFFLVPENDSAISDLTIGPKGDIAFVHDDGTTDLRTARSDYSMGHSSPTLGKKCKAIAFATSDSVGVGCSNAVVIWKPLTGEVNTIGVADDVVSLAFNNDGSKMAYGTTTGMVGVLNTADKSRVLLEQLEADKGDVSSVKYVSAVAFRQDDAEYLVATSRGDDTVVQWDLNDPNRPLRMVGHEGDVSVVALASTPNGQFIVSGADDDNTRVWNAETGEAVGPPLFRISDVTSVAVTRTEIVTSHRDGVLVSYPGPSTWQHLVCQKLDSAPTEAQWQDWVGRPKGEFPCTELDTPEQPPR